MNRTPWFTLGMIAAGAALIATGIATQAAPSAKTIDVDASDYKFAPGAMEAETSESITINLKNVGARRHDIVFELDNGRREATTQINGGQSASVTFLAPAATGEYVFYCSVGQHRALGMEGKLTITGGSIPLTPITELNNPHGLSANPDGTILVGEGGTGEPKPGMFTPGNADGRVQRISLADPMERSTIVERMTNSIDPGGGIVGANHAIRWGLAGPATSTASVVLVAQSGGPGQAQPEDAAKILKVEDSQSSILADPLAYERANNPAGEPGEAGMDSNPWRLIPGPDNKIYIPDSGANDVLKMDPATGALSTYAIFAPINDNDATPTGMAFDPTRPGVAYVAQLAFAMPPAPSGQIRRLEDKNSDGDALDEGENTLLVDGLLNPTDLAFSPSGHLFVTEIAPSTLGRIDPACFSAATACQAAAARTVVAADLYGASALAFDTAGNALVATNTKLPPDRPSTNASNQITRLPASSLIPGVEPTNTPTPATPTPTREEPTPTQQATPIPTVTGRSFVYMPMAAKGANLR